MNESAFLAAMRRLNHELAALTDHGECGEENEVRSAAIEPPNAPRGSGGRRLSS